MKKSIGILFCAVLSMIIFSSEVKAQSDGSMSYYLDTLRNKMYPYNLVVSVGAVVDLDLAGGQLNAYNAGIYARARYTLAKRFQFAGYYQFLPGSAFKGNAIGDNASNLYYGYVRASFIMKKKAVPQMTLFKLGQSGNYKYTANIPVATGTYQGITASLNAYSGVNYIKNDPYHRSWELTQVSNNKVVDTNDVSAFVKSQTIGFGYMFSQSMNFKGKFKTTGMGNKIRRKRNTMDFAFELLFAPNITVYDQNGNTDNGSGKVNPLSVSKESGNFDELNVNKFYLNNVQKSRLGWRIQSEMTKGILNFHIELGSRPGLTTYLNQDAEKIKFFEKPFARLYMQWGIGIGIGAL